MEGEISDITGMSQEPLVTEELIARQPPEVQAIIRLLPAKIAELEARLNKTSRNSSRPPGSKPGRSGSACAVKRL